MWIAKHHNVKEINKGFPFLFLVRTFSFLIKLSELLFIKSLIDFFCESFLTPMVIPLNDEIILEVA